MLSRSLMEQNIGAVASSSLDATEATLSDAELAAFAELRRPYPAAYGDVRAMVLTRQSARRLRAGGWTRRPRACRR